MRLKQLEIMLSRLEGIPHPIAAWEQYQTPSSLAARVLYHAAMKGDVGGCAICDLGCGNGIFAIGSALLGASRVTGTDIDRDALLVAEKNAEKMDVAIEFVNGDISDLAFLAGLGHFDTIITNPPFGAQKAHADRPFIDAGIALGDIMYAIFNEGSIGFVKSYIQGRAGISDIIRGKFPLKRTFSFHTRDMQEIEVEILRIEVEKPLV